MMNYKNILLCKNEIAAIRYQCRKYAHTRSYYVVATEHNFLCEQQHRYTKIRAEEFSLKSISGSTFITAVRSIRYG